MSGPPNFPIAWSAAPQTNMSNVGFDAGTVGINWFGSCSDPATQRMKTVYPDNYTVLTLCAERLQYVVSPNSRGGTCAAWPISNEQAADLCTLCGCPFCLRDTAGMWTSFPKRDAAVQWSSDVERRVSRITGETVQVWSGKQRGSGGSTLEVEFAATLSGAPHTLLVNSPLWMSTATFFKGFTPSVPKGAFDVPRICVDGARSKPRGTPRLLGEPGDATAAPPNASQSPPAFPATFSAALLVNISQPGYDGGNVFQNFSGDCSAGPFAQRSKTTFGNFHTVLLRCDENRIYRYDLSGIDCSTSEIPSDVSARVCAACTVRASVRTLGCSGCCNRPSFNLDSRCLRSRPQLPFSVRDSGGIYTTDGRLDGFKWQRLPAAGSRLRYKGVEMSSTVAQEVTMEATFDADGTPRLISVAQPGWQRTTLRISNFQTVLKPGTFDLPACFGPPPVLMFWSGWLLVGGSLLVTSTVIVVGTLLWRQQTRARAKRAVPRLDPRLEANTCRESVSALLTIAVSYTLASTFEAPMVMQANEIPNTFKLPTLAGGGFCYTPPCEPFSGKYKPPWWVNPTNVVTNTCGRDMTHVCVFYFYFAGLILASMLAQQWPLARTLCLRSVRLRLPGLTWHSCVGEVLTLVTLVLWLIYFVVVFVHDGFFDLPRPSPNEPQTPTSKQFRDLGSACAPLACTQGAARPHARRASGRTLLARALHSHPRPRLPPASSPPTTTAIANNFPPRTPLAGGNILNILVPLAIMPVSRSAGLVRALGVSWERALAYHRTMGAAVVVLGSAHVALQHARWIAEGVYLSYLFGYAASHRGLDVWPWAVPMMHFAYCAVLIAALAACEPIRRRSYRVFYCTHIVVSAPPAACLP